MTTSDAEVQRPREGGGPPICAFCGFPCPPSPVTSTHEGRVYTFCSQVCRDALAEDGYESPPVEGCNRFTPGVPLLEPRLPEGIPRNTMTMVSSEPGTRGDELLVELVWYALQRGGTAVIVTFQEPPMSFLERFFALRWNVIPYLERGRLQLVDCFTHWMEEVQRMFDRMDRWNEHLHRASKDATRVVSDPRNLNSVHNALDECIETGDVREQGVVAFHSLTELGALVQPVQAYDFVKSFRADVTKSRSIPVFAQASYRNDDEEFPHDLTYMFDGIVDMRLNEDLVDEEAIKQLRVRKMTGVPAKSEWVAYEYASNRGLVPAEPSSTPNASNAPNAPNEQTPP